MRQILHETRLPIPKSIAENIRRTIIAVAAGLLLGISSKLLDISSHPLGDVFSQMSIWILLCTILAVYSSTPYWAGLQVFLFCGGMLAAYYLTAAWTDSVYSMTFIWGWAIFSLGSPMLAFFAWYAKGQGWFSNLLTIGILVVMFLCAIVLFDKIRLSDCLFAVFTGAILRK